MRATLLNQFLDEECTPYVRGLLANALGAAASPTKHFEFNRFEVTIDREHGSVLIEDVLDATDAGALRVSLADFVTALDRPVA